MPRILIDRIGGDVSQGIARCIKEAMPDVQLVGIDRVQDCGWQLYCDEWVREDSHEHRVAEGLRFPREAGGAVVYICGDKLRTQTFLQWIGIEPLKTWTEDPNEYPVFFKPRDGHGSKGAFVVRDPEQATHLMGLYPNGIFQEYLGEQYTEVTCPVYRFRDGRIRVLQLERKLMGGFTFWAKVIDKQEIESACRKVAEGLGVFGAINVQLKYRYNEVKIFEVNPRFSSTVYMRHVLGFTDAVWAARELMGERVENIPTIKEGQVVVRVQGAQILEEAKA